MEERKRRRDSRPPTPSPSTSRSPSPSTLRHRRASDAAVALLGGKPGAMTSTSSQSSYASSDCSSRQSRRRSRPEYRASSPYSRSSSRAPSTVCSSYASSPAFGQGHGIHTPASPCTPAGPLTPETACKSGLPSSAAAKLEEAFAAYQPHCGQSTSPEPVVVDSISPFDNEAAAPSLEAW